MPRICEIDGCSQNHRAKGLCSTHYNNKFNPDRHTTARRCERCDHTYTSTRSNGRYCSLACRDDARTQATRQLVHVGPSLRCDVPSRHPSRTPKPEKTWWTFVIQGRCRWCGQSFTGLTASTRNLSAYCSTRCQRNSSKYRRGRFVVTESQRTRIYERDGWTCQICGNTAATEYRHDDPMSPTLDHIVPRSKGGPDTDENLRLAHAVCNSHRGTETVVNWRERLDEVLSHV